VIDLANETILPLSDAPRHPLLKRGRRAGRPIHRATLERWRTRGVGGIILETAKLGGIRVTTVEAIERFFDRLNTPGATSDSPTVHDIARAHAQAERELAAAGI
jgi:hypothetical protein